MYTRARSPPSPSRRRLKNECARLPAQGEPAAAELEGLQPLQERHAEQRSVHVGAVDADGHVPQLDGTDGECIERVGRARADTVCRLVAAGEMQRGDVDA